MEAPSTISLRVVTNIGFDSTRFDSVSNIMLCRKYRRLNNQCDITRRNRKLLSCFYAPIFDLLSLANQEKGMDIDCLTQNVRKASVLPILKAMCERSQLVRALHQGRIISVWFDLIEQFIGSG